MSTTLRLHTHETLQSFDTVSQSSERVFGLVLGGFLTLMGYAPLLHGQGIRVWALLLALALVIPAIIAPNVLKPLNNAWTQLGLWLNRLISPIILGLIFFLVLTPMAILRRSVGNSALTLARKTQANSYWVTKPASGPPRESMKDPF